ncbi:MAG: hypothetical protein ACXVEU_02060 [Nocardioidaceae bacterium]
MPKHRDRHAHGPASSHAPHQGHPSGAHLSSGHARRPYVAAAGVAVLAVIAVVSVLTLVSNEATPGTPGGTARPVASASPARPAGTASSAVGQAIADCRARWGAQGLVLQEAAPALQQWRVHIGAMNQLVAGTISLGQAQAFWTRTRHGAVRRTDRFEQAVQQYRASRPPACVMPAHSAVVSRMRALRSCVAAVAARQAAVVSAKTTIATWRRHIGDMERLRSGAMSPTMAQQMWLRNWHLGAAQLRDYHRAVGRAQDVRCPG